MRTRLDAFKLIFWQSIWLHSLCFQNLTQVEFYPNGLICFEEEISAHESVQAVSWIPLIILRHIYYETKYEAETLTTVKFDEESYVNKLKVSHGKCR